MAGKHEGDNTSEGWDVLLCPVLRVEAVPRTRARSKAMEHQPNEAVHSQTRNQISAKTTKREVNLWGLSHLTSKGDFLGNGR